MIKAIEKITQKQIENVQKNYYTDEHAELIREHPLYACTDGISAKHIIAIAKLLEYDLDALDQITIKFEKIKK